MNIRSLLLFVAFSILIAGCFTPEPLPRYRKEGFGTEAEYQEYLDHERRKRNAEWAERHAKDCEILAKKWATEHRLTLDEWRTLLVSQKGDAVIALMGRRPDDTFSEGTRWIYREVVYDPVSGKLKSLQFRCGTYISGGFTEVSDISEW